MTTILKMVQGAGQIGGNIVIIEGYNSRIVIDFGIPLTELNGNPIDLKPNDETVKKYLPDIPDLYNDTQEKETVILLSHAHPDHFGLMRYLNKSIPIYTTQTTKSLIKKCSNILYKNLYNTLNLQEIKDKKEFCDFIIQTFPVDHSVGGACAFKITDRVTGKTILYSGDIRCHGRNKKDINKFINNNKKTDYFIVEGTTLSRDGYSIKSEKEIENEFVKKIEQNKVNIVCCSPLNIQRIISVYNACIRANKTLVIDPYTAYMLEVYADKEIPNYKSEHLKVYCVPNTQTKKIFKDESYKKYHKNKITFKEIMKNPENYVIKDNARVSKSILKRIDINDINIIYSYWEGYLDKENCRWNKYKDKLQKIHTSGHIKENDLIDLITKINPKKIIPIHTLYANKFEQYFKEKTIIMKNNTKLKVS